MAMQTDVRPFIQTGNTVSLAATGVSISTAISAPRSLVPQLPGTMRVYNAGSGLVWIAQGSGSATANSTIPTSSLPIPVGNTEVFQLLPDTTFVAAVCTSSLTAVVYFTPGQGA
jgi:hypothetical protein